ncbi:MAG: hypothetical protein KatS3mg077_2724 [Candidatus Binatia bacterium]|nr:MAG: hypothetical protein KatS3mg077_2724 [Candidatus Binatia bacterium]
MQHSVEMPNNTRRIVAALLVLLTVLLGSARAEVSTDQPGAVVWFPKVVRDSARDTIIQISNTTGVRISLLCIYVNAAPDPSSGLPLWQAVDFQIALTRQQPTIWVAGTGLGPQPSDGRPADLHPGLIPPLAEGFIGELRCFVTEEGDTPSQRNALIGEATVVERQSGTIWKYPGVTFRSMGTNNRDKILALDDREYSACPRILLLNHFYQDAPDPVTGVPVSTTVTFVPCSADFERAQPVTTNLLFETFNEFEQRLSASLEVTCFSDLPLTWIDSRPDPTRSVFHFGVQGTIAGQTRIRPVPSRSITQGTGVLIVAEESRGNGFGTTALPAHFIGGALQGDVIVLPSSF